MTPAAARSANVEVPVHRGRGLSARRDALLCEAPGPMTEEKAPATMSRVVYRTLATDAEGRDQRCSAMRADLQNVDDVLSRPAAWKPLATHVGMVGR